MNAELLNWSGQVFSKGHGTGNDFVLIADPAGEQELSASAVVAICDRRLGIGADGVIRAVKSSNLAEGRALTETAPEAEWFMDYRNSDGTIAEMCGNGVRVFVQFLLDEGLISLQLGETLPVGTRAGVKLVERTAQGFAVDMGVWNFIFPELAAARGVDSLVTADSLEVARPALSISTGNAHTVVALANRSELDELELFKEPIVEPAAEHGSNVEFALPDEPLVSDGVATISMRVHERGSGETYSCGTGACAAALATRFWAGEGAPNDWQVNVPGGQLQVTFFIGADGKEHIRLSGPAVIVANGTFI
ncbi:diaminopimelate epimerase [Psychromicrobium lacuslunae]|uniref:Diaminopimelate epimerase n=1 Tax=Psychromicrobium lacuslunae TaxID=1618207 RepID=A0A0D4C2M5_9MICC|nr:diaminopimelate epimerase [Psychromicrobium lacuslunae]